MRESTTLSRMALSRSSTLIPSNGSYGVVSMPNSDLTPFFSLPIVPILRSRSVQLNSGSSVSFCFTATLVSRDLDFMIMTSVSITAVLTARPLSTLPRSMTFCCSVSSWTTELAWYSGVWLNVEYATSVNTVRKLNAISQKRRYTAPNRDFRSVGILLSSVSASAGTCDGSSKLNVLVKRIYRWLELASCRRPTGKPVTCDYEQIKDECELKCRAGRQNSSRSLQTTDRCDRAPHDARRRSDGHACSSCRFR